MKRFYILLFICLFLFSYSGIQAYQIILFGEDPVMSVNSTKWTLDKTGTFLHSFKFSATSSGTGSAKAIWTLDGIPAGDYQVEFYVDNGDYAQNAEYIVEHEYGISTVICSQNFVGTGWHNLSTFRFNFAGRISQTDHWTGAGTKVIADSIRLTYQGTPILPTVDVITPAITICIDDLGALNPNDTTSYTGQLFSQCTDFSYAVFPDSSYTQAVLQAASTKRIETILHQAMQYVGQADYSAADTIRLYIGMTQSEISTCLLRNIQTEAAYISGVNIHQGSRFSEYSSGMQTVLNILKSRGLYFYDSRTITDSVAYDISKQTGLLTAERDLFIDGNTTDETKGYIFSMATMAKYSPNYNYLGIGHQRTYTVPALLEILPGLQSMGVKLRRLSKNLAYIMETDFQPNGASLQLNGSWQTTANDLISTECYDGNAYYHTGNTYASAKFIPNLPKEGQYQAFIGFTADTLNSDSVKIIVRGNNGDKQFILNQSVEGNRWHYIGTYSFASGTSGFIQLDNSLESHPAHILRADCVKLVYTDLPLTIIPDWSIY